MESLLDFAGYFASPCLVEGRGYVQNEGDDQEFPIVDQWQYSRARQNTMIAIKLRPRALSSNHVFAVATYHMPCAFWNPKVMVIHSALASQFAQRFAGDHPLVLAGDWNFKP